MPRVFSHKVHLHTLAVLGIVVVALGFGWLTRGLARAYLETKTAHIFPTAVEADGWENPNAARALDVPADAPYASFTNDNSAYVSIGTTTDTVPVEAPAAPITPTESAASDTPPTDTAPTDTPANTEHVDAPATPTPVPADTPATDTPAADPAPVSDPIPSDSPTSYVGSLFARIEQMAAPALVFATSTDSATTGDARTTLAAVPTSTPSTVTASSTDVGTPVPLSWHDVALCSVLARPCHAIELSGFDVSGSLTDKKFKSATVNFSFASHAPASDTAQESLVVRYYHAGVWKQAGEVFMNKELSNASNGSYFTAVLDGITQWDDLSDVRILVEYERDDDTQATRAFLDAVWLDATYQDRAQEVLGGDAPSPGDAPSNISFADVGQTVDKPRLLIQDDGTQIALRFTSAGGALVFRSDRETYAATPTPRDGSTAYLSITNTSDSRGTFRLAAAFPDGARLASLEQYMRNVPHTIETPVFQDVTYRCDGGWQAATDTTAYLCGATGEHEQCSAVNETGENCTVPHVRTATTTTISYTSGWVPYELSDTNLPSTDLPVGYTFAQSTRDTLSIEAGQTIYVRASFVAQTNQPARFVLLADGNLDGSLDSSAVVRESTARAASQPVPRERVRRMQPLKHTDHNDQLSAQTDFDAGASPEFSFRYRTQRPFLRRVLDAATGTAVPYRVVDTKLVRDDGAIESAVPDITYSANGQWHLAFDTPPHAFRPGRYTLELTIDEGGATSTDSLEFYWGVLAVNTDKSPYTPGDTAHLSLAALDENGDTLCDAHLTLSITAPSGVVSDVPVSKSGSCGPNNVTDVPDYLADYPVAEEGTYAVSLRELDSTGATIAATNDAFTASASSTYWIARSGPTRIYPPSAYHMELTVHATRAFQGTLREEVPEGFVVSGLGEGTVRREAGVQYIEWPVSLGEGESTTRAYAFKAPDVSPYVFLVGSAQIALDGTTVFDEGRQWKIASDALAIATGVAWLSGTTTASGIELNNTTPTALSWSTSADYDTTYFSYSSSSPSQLVVNQDGDYYIALTLPMNRTDTSTRDTRVEAAVYINGGAKAFAVSRSAFIGNSSNQNSSSDHLAVLLRNLHAGDYVEVYENSPDTVNANDHINITGVASLYAEYVDPAQQVYFGVGTTTSSGTNMNPTATSTVYWYDDSSGRADSNFTHGNSSSPGDISLAAGGYYLVDVSVPLSGGVASANVRGRILMNNSMVAGGDFKQGYMSTANGDNASSIHFSGVVYATTTNEKLSVTVFQEGAAGTLTVGSNQASVYIQQLPSSYVFAARTKSLTGGTNWNVSPKQAASWTTEDVRDSTYYSHSTTTNAQNITISRAGDYLLVFNDSRAAAVSFPNQTVTVEVNGTEVTGAQTKTHVAANASGNIESSGSLTFLLRNLAVNDVVTVSAVRSGNTGTITSDQDAVLMLWYKAAQSSYIQGTERWYANTNAQTPTDPWPSGAVDLNEGDAITSGVSVKSGDVLRVRMALQATVTTSAGADTFKLQYAAGSTCSPALAWTDVGAVGSGSIWRGYDNATPADGSTITSQLLSVSSTSETYEEGNPSATTPNGVSAGKDGEWDWTLQDNGAVTGAQYCFRMVSASGQVLKDYNDYPQLTTNGSPDAPTLSKLFDNEKTASTTPWFEFSSSDPNGEDIHYEVQVSTDSAFGSTVIDKDSVTNFAQFSNIVTSSDKAPFNTDETVRFVPTTALSNNTTYYWRVRAKDTAGTNTWGSWSSSRSFTVDTSVTVSTWFQTTAPQFSNDTLSNLATSSDTVVLSGSNTTGTLWSPEIDYSQHATGNSWGTLTWTDTHTGGTLLYHVEYLTATSSWALVPDSDLAGNGAGTSTQPINLAGLDPSTYSSIRVRADFTKTSSTPILSDWTLSWALSVSAPTLTTLFDNEKPGTTTPTFTFTSTDPQGDDLVYQIQWSTDNTFTTSVSSSTSDTGGSAFSNTASSTDTSPFAQGQTVSFKVPQASALTNGTTYWWRVRAKDPAGGNAYSLWSSSRSFTVDTSVLVSTWFQTTTAQFSADAIVKAIASGNAITVSTDVGKIAIYREATAGDAITTATFWQNFDTVVRQDDIYSMTASTSVKLKQGHYAVFYNDRYDSTGGTRRSEIQSSLDLASTTLPIGWSQGFISRTTANAGFTAGGGIIYASADNSPLTVLTFRTDTNTTATLSRTANTAGLSLIRLDDNWDYARLSKSAKQAGPTSGSWTTVNYDTEDELDTGSFVHSQGSGNLVLHSPGHYLVFANTYGSLASGSTVETQVKQRLALDGAEVQGSYTTVYMRGNTNTNGAYQGAAAIGMIIQSTSTDQVLTVQVARAMGTAAWTINADQTGAYVNRTGLTVVKLPEGDFLQLQDTGTQNMNPASLTAHTWNTEAEKDTASWTHSTVTNASRMTANLSGDYLFLGALYAQAAGITNGDYVQGWRKNGGTLVQYGQTGGLSTNTTTADDGNWSGIIFPSMINGDYAELVAQAAGAAGTMAADKKGVTAVRIGSLSEADANTPTATSTDITFSDGTGPKWSQVSWSKTTPGSSSIVMQVYYASSTAAGGYALVPNTDLAGNSSGTTTSPIDISHLSRLTYPTLRLKAVLNCVAGSCPSLNDWTVTWSAGIQISGTAKQFDQTTNLTSGTVAVAVNGVLQSGKTGTISGGAWTISNVTAFTGDVITVFIQGASDPHKAVAVTKYTTDGDISGMVLYENHLTLGSNDLPLITNADIGQYDNSVSANSALFDDVSTGNALTVCSVTLGCYNARLLVLSGTTYQPSSTSGGNVTTRNFQNNGVFIANGNTITVSGSWRNAGNFVAGTSNVLFSATSTTETIDSTGATSTAFSAVSFGSGSGSATWNLLSGLYASSTFSINYGTLNQNGANPIGLSGDFAIGASGVFTKGTATTTFMGSGTNSWTDASASKQDMGTVVIDGSAKTIAMGSGVKATDVSIGADDILSAGGAFTIEVKGNWTNNNSFLAQTGTVNFTATSAGKVIQPGSSSFYDITFNGVGGGWSFATSTVSVGDNFTIATGTVTLAAGTTTVSGSFTNTGGAFAHNNGTVYLTTAGSKSVQAGGSSFYDLSFNGSGSWAFADTNATSSRHVTITSGSVTLPSGTFAVGGSFFRNGGSFNANSGTLRLFASSAQTVKLNGTSASNITFDGSGGSWVFGTSAATTTGNVRFDAGAVTLPGASIAVGGSWTVTNGSFAHNNTLVRFTATATGKTIDPKTSNFYDIDFASATGGWTISGNATTTHNASITTAGSFALASGKTLEVDGMFTNLVGGTSTTWTGSTLYLNSGTSYTLNTKSAGGDAYGTLALGGTTKVKMWNSSASTATMPATAYLYSMNNAGTAGELDIWGTYANSSDEHWDYATDFDGAALGVSRAASIKIASGSSVTLGTGTLSITGAAGATTTIDNQGSGSYSLAITGGSLSAQYYSLRHIDVNGMQFSGAPTISSLSDGDIEVSASGGSGMTVASTAITQNPALQIQRMRFATTTAISATNVTETGAPTGYWWFRNHVGNLAGESYDSDPGGNPGYVRWDDSNYDIAVSGTVYSDHGTTALGSPCDGTTANVKLAVDYGATTYTTSCNASTGAYSFPHVLFIGDVTFTVFLDTNGGTRAATVTRTPTGSITGLDLYKNAVIVREEDVSALSIASMARYDSTKDSDVPFTAATSSTDTLAVRPDFELVIWGGKTFAPGGNMTLSSGGSGSATDGRLYLLPSAAFTSAGTQSHSIGGSLYVGTSSTFTAASSTFTFAATTTGKTIYSAVPLSFYDLSFSGSGGAWTLASMSLATTTAHTASISAGTLSGTGDIVVQSGGFTGSGTVAMTGGTVRLEGTGNLGGVAGWQFYDLVLGSTTANTITKNGAGTTTIAHVLSLPVNATLNAGSAPWVLLGGGTPFVLAGTFSVQSAPFSYTASSATNVAATTYAGLTLAPAAAGSPTYTLLGGTLYTATTTIGDGSHAVSVTADTNDPALSWGDVVISPSATLVASNVGAFDVTGSWTNTGTFTHSNGAVRFTALATGKTLTAGGSSFYDLSFNSTTGGWTMLDNATTTHDFTLTNASSFTKTSGTSLAVQGTFTNGVGGAATTWTGSTLFLTSGTSYALNTKTDTGDTYGTLLIGPSTNLRMWNSSAATTTVPSSASLYSMNHASSSGALYIWGSYGRASGSDYWSYATDFDGTDISGAPRAVHVYVASSSSVTLSGGLLDIIGSASATTTIDNQGNGFYSLGVSGGSLNANYYSVRHTDADGLNLSGSPTITSLSYGDYELSYPGGSLIAVAGTTITANPLKIIQSARFATTTAITGTNVKATGTTASSWKFNLHYGNLAGEAFDSDPAGDPGYIRWDDSASQITIAGKVYSDEGTTVSSVCDGSTQVVRLKVQGAGSYTSSCSASTGDYAIPGVGYNPGDTLTVYLDTNGGRRAATVSADPLTNIGNFDLYENRVIVRHEDTSPMTITKMAQYDSANDSDIPFRAISGGSPTLTVQPNTKLIVWAGKTFAPAGNVTLQSGNSTAWDGTLALQSSATFTAAASQSHFIGGSLTLASGAAITPSTSTFTFAATTTGKTLDFGPNGLYNVVFNGSGGNWSFSTSTTAVHDLTITAGSLTLPTATTTIAGSFTDNASFAHNNGIVVFSATAAGNTVKAGGSSFYALRFDGVGGSWNFADTNATSSSNFTVATGTVTLPSGVFAVGSSFVNTGAFTAGTGTVRLTASATGKTITAGGSNFYNLVFDGAGGAWTFSDSRATTTRDFIITTGSTTLPAAMLSVGGSFTNAGTCTALTSTVKLTATTTGKTVTLGGSNLYDVLFDSAAGGWTMTDNATSTHDFTLAHAAAFTKTSGTALAVLGTFTNQVGGAPTTWAGSTLFLNSGASYSLNTKTTGGDTYGTLLLGVATNIRMWNSSATVTTVPTSASLYSMNHAAVSGALGIWGTYTLSSGADYWSYATDFDGTALGGGSRQVAVTVASSSVVTYQSGAALHVVGVAGATTTIANQGSGFYSLIISGATLDATRFSIRNTDANGLQFSGAPSISAFSYGDLELSYPGGSLITAAASAVDANASQTFTGFRFATTTAIGGYNVTRTGSPVGAWSFQSYIGNLSGEAFDGDGGDACGFIRWSDSTCLFVSQEHFRFRNDDGGVGVPSSEWYNASWAKRKSIKIGNPNTSAYTNVPVKVVVDYDSDMRSDFADLRFTDSSGTSTIPFWSESSVSSASTTLWVQVPSLPASGDATIYMYYGNASASSASDGASTFTFFEDFESASFASYSGNTSLFHIGTTFAHNHTYGLDAGSNVSQKTTTGIYRSTAYFGRGSTVRFYQYVDASQQDEPCTLFAVGGSGSNYAVCLDEYPSQTLEIAKNVTSNEDSGTVLATTSASYSTGWYQVVIDWLTTNLISVRVYDAAGTLFASLSTSDSSHTGSGGIGFSFWGQHGGWDFYTARPYMASTPTYSFGGEQVSGGASWAAAEDTALSAVAAGDQVRLRFSVQNTGAALSGTHLRLQVAPLGASASCEAVPHVNFSDVPTTTGGCGSAVACMKTTTQYADQTTAADLLSFPSSLSFASGYAVKDPSNQTNAITVPSYGATESEYTFQFTSNATADSYCLRTTDSGASLDNYQHVAKVTLLHPPVISNLSLNLDADIALTEGATTTVYASSTISDDNGYQDIVHASSTIFREGVGALCSPNDNNCYQVSSSSCVYSNCAGTSCTLQCRADLQYIAEPTDAGSTYASQSWFARLFLRDSTGLTALATSSAIDVLTLRGLQIGTPDIDFGSLSAGGDTGSVNAQTTIVNTGNTPIGIQVSGTDLAGGVSIPVGSQKYATSTFAYGTCSICQFLTGSATNVDVSLAKPTATTTPVSSDIYWGISVPNGTDATVHTGTNTFTATAP